MNLNLVCKKCNVEKDSKLFDFRYPINNELKYCNDCFEEYIILDTQGKKSSINTRRNFLLRGTQYHSCGWCLIIKNRSDFKISKTKIESLCKLCRKNYQSKYYRSSPSTFKDKNLKTKYGISLSQYNQMLLKQDNKCFLCKVDSNILKHALAVDHCHETGRVRKLLCHNCNGAVGFTKENTSTLQRTIEYLNEYNRNVDNTTHSSYLYDTETFNY
jgi:hypothetical protein